jgi:hypothetical protein
MRRFFKRVREIFESVAYAGLQPGAPLGESKKLKWLGPLRGPVERFLSGPAPSDPLYLTNRTTGSKVKIGLAVGIPCLILAGALYGVLTDSFDLPDPKPEHETTNAEAAAKLLPKLDQHMTIDTNHDINVMEVRVEHGNPVNLVGTLRNNTDHEIHMAEAVFDVTDVGGSQLGAVSARVENLKAGSTAGFRVAIPESAAAFALVREVHAQ